jgi:hypothetical protein
MLEASDWLHCPFDSSTLPSEKTVRMRQQGKAVGCVPLTALLRLPRISVTANHESARVEQMYTAEIRADHCYSMTPIKGRRTIARVTKLFNITAMAAYEDVKRGETDSLAMNPTVVRFVWRHASYPTGWSKRQQQLLLDDFALAAEEEVAGS